MLVDGASRLLSMRAERGTYHLRAMPPILTLSKISKRFGAVVVADGIDLALARRRGARHHRSERRRQDHAVRHHHRHGRAGCRARVLRRTATSPAPTPERRCRDGHRALVPDPAAVRRHDRVREPGGGGGLRQRPARARRLCPLRRRCSSNAASPTRPTARPAALTLLDRKRLELARALATAPRVLLLDEVAGGLIEHETAALVSLVKEVRATGVSIIWIEHVVHALIAAVDRLVVLHGGALIAEGEPRR